MKPLDAGRMVGRAYAPRYDFASMRAGEKREVDGTFRQVTDARNYFVRKHPEMRGKIRVHNVSGNAGRAIIVRV